MAMKTLPTAQDLMRMFPKYKIAYKNVRKTSYNNLIEAIQEYEQLQKGKALTLDK